MALAVILTAHEIDYKAVRNHLTELKEETHTQGTVYELGHFSGDEQTWEVAIAEIDNSNTSAASETERAISYFNPDVIFLVGAANGINRVSIGDVLVATKVYGYESGTAENKFLSQPEVQEPSYQLRARAKAERKKTDWLNRLSSRNANSSVDIHLVPIASGEKEIGNNQIETELLLFLNTQYNDAVAVENLGLGFLKAANANEKTFALIVYGISSLISVNVETIQADSRAIALQNASAFTFEILAKYKISDTGTNQRSRGMVLCGMTSDTLLAAIGKQFEVVEINSLTDERHRRIDHAKILINQGQFNYAVQYLEELKVELWSRLDNILKYRLLSNFGVAKLGLDEISDAAASFIEAVQYNPEDDTAIAYAAMGYCFQRDYTNAENLVDKALQKNPANVLAYSLCIRIYPITESIESVLGKIPPPYRESLDVLIALGEAALNRKLYNKAEEWLQKALHIKQDISMISVKAFLGVSLIEPIAENFVLIAAGQMLECQKHSLERAISLFTDVLGGNYVDPKDLSHLKFTTLVNRSSALRLLGRYDEAIRDIEIALQKEPNNSYLIKQRALLAHEKEDEAAAHEYATHILSSPEVPEAFLLLASSLMALNRDQEAEEILNQFLKTDSSEELKREANRLKFEIFLERGDKQQAEEVLHNLNNEDPESVFTLVHNIRWHIHNHSAENVSALVEKAKESLLSENSVLSQIRLADTLYSLQYYRDAAEVYEMFVDKTCNSSLCHKLAHTYYLAGDYKSSLDLCKRLLAQDSFLPVISDIAAFIYEDIGDLAAARQICENHLKNHPDDPIMQLRLAIVDYSTENYDSLDRFLDSNPNIENLSLVALIKLSQLYKFRNRIDKFLDLIYEIRHRFYSDEKGQVHSFYQIAYIEAKKIQPRDSIVEIVQDGCGVLIKNEFGKEAWYILENRPDADFAKNELNSKHPLYQDLIGKHTKDEIIQAKDKFGCSSLKILAITDKYFAASKQSFSILENQTNTKNFRIIPITMDGDDVSPSWVDQFIDGLQEFQDNFERIKAEYISGKFPLGSVAILNNRNLIETWQNLTFGENPFIHSWSNFERFEDALINLQKGGLVVIDPISLITLHHLEIADNVVSVIGKFGIAQSTIRLLQAMVETAQISQCGGFTTFAVSKGRGIFQEFSSDTVTQQKKFFEGIIDWVKINCQVLPCHRALDINKTERDKLTQYIDSASIDTVLIAGESGRIFYSDDQWLRWYAHSDSGVAGVWTQVVLKYCLLQQNSNVSLYSKAILDLVIHGYIYTIIDAPILMEAVRLSQWQPQPIYTSALKALANENTNLDYAVHVSTDFLRQLYLEPVTKDNQVIDPRDALIFELLSVQTEKCSKRTFVQELQKAVQQRFKVMPLQQQNVIKVIYAWLTSQIIIT